MVYVDLLGQPIKIQTNITYKQYIKNNSRIVEFWLMDTSYRFETYSKLEFIFDNVPNLKNCPRISTMLKLRTSYCENLFCFFSRIKSLIKNFYRCAQRLIASSKNEINTIFLFLMD